MSVTNMSIFKSAVYQITRFRKPIFEYLPFSTTNCTLNLNMSNWENEKSKFLSLDLESKRKGYKKYQELKDIPTWREYVGINSANLRAKVNLLPGYSIDHSKNEILVDKISYYTGDITALEVDERFIIIHHY